MPFIQQLQGDDDDDRVVVVVVVAVGGRHTTNARLRKVGTTAAWAATLRASRPNGVERGGGGFVLAPISAPRFTTAM